MSPLTSDPRTRCRSRESSERGAAVASLPFGEMGFTGELSKESSSVSGSIVFSNERWSSGALAGPVRFNLGVLVSVARYLVVSSGRVVIVRREVISVREQASCLLSTAMQPPFVGAQAKGLE